MNQQIDIGTGVIRLTDYLPPAAVLMEYVLGAVVAFAVVQQIVARRRVIGPHMTGADRAFRAAIVTTLAIAVQLWAAHDYPAKQTIAYALQGGLLAPVTITVLLWLLERFAPALRQSLRQDRRTRDDPTLAAQERRVDDTKFL